ncbi:MAG: PTS sugar transporter subunit IIC [Mycoplasma sp.]|nr:PTS sugar transporter subunit IIC [Mycoplasma sp.]
MIGVIGYGFQAMGAQFKIENKTYKAIGDGIKNIGMIGITNIDFLFAIGLTAGLAKKEKLSAALSGLMALAALYFSSAFMLSLMGITAKDAKDNKEIAAILKGTITRFGVTGWSYGALGGILAALMAFWVHKHTYKIKFPQIFSFFGGPRFSPVATTFVVYTFGLLLAFIWVYLSYGIDAIGRGISPEKIGAGAPFLYGLLERLLLPFGLHQILNNMLYYTQVGGVWEQSNGKQIYGVYNIAMAKLFDDQYKKILNSNDTWIINGTYVTKIFSVSSIGLAIYYACPKENRKKIFGAISSSILASAISGITEPVEFMFVFIAPYLHFLHAILSGLFNMIMWLFNFTAVSTRGSGIFTWLLVNGLGWTKITKPWGLFIVGPIAGVVYFVIFYFAITYFDIQTLGREKEEIASNQELREINNDNNLTLAQIIVKSLGGKDNILNVSNCATRLRVKLKDIKLFDPVLIKQTKNYGQLISSNEIQIIYGTNVINIASDVKELLNISD